MQALCKRIAENPTFQGTVIALIFLVGIILGLETSESIMDGYGELLHGLDTFILWLFAFELVVRIGSFGSKPWRFFKDPWNTFDFVIVAICFLPMWGHFAAVLRMARILRLLRLLTVIPQLQLLVGSLLKSIPSMGYVALLLLIQFYMYAIIGVFAFREQAPQFFGSLGLSMLSLFQVVTLESWPDILQALIYNESPSGERVWSDVSTGALVYMISFILVGTMVIMNLLIGVILNGMEEMQKEMMEELHKRQDKADPPGSLSEEIKQLEKNLENMQRNLRQLRNRVAEQRSKNSRA